MRGKLIGAALSTLVVPLAIFTGAVINRAQNWFEVPLWLSSLIGVISLGVGAMAFGIRHEENERRIQYMQKREEMMHYRRHHPKGLHGHSQLCSDPSFHGPQPFHPETPRS